MIRNHLLAAFIGVKDNNAILADVGHVTHNFAPFLDMRPGVPKAERFKAVGGSSESGLVGYVSEDGIHFRKLQDKPIRLRFRLKDADLFALQFVK